MSKKIVFRCRFCGVERDSHFGVFTIDHGLRTDPDFFVVEEPWCRKCGIKMDPRNPENFDRGWRD